MTTNISLLAATALGGFALVASSLAFGQTDEALGRLPETTAAQALIVDGETGAVLFEKDADTPFPPASLAKVMTMEVVFDAVAKGDLSLDRAFPVSEHAWRTGGAPSGTSTMFAALKSSVPVIDLVRGTIVQAANDATIILAEGMSGSEAGFAERMNERAAELGLTSSRFVNPSGLPADGQQVTARDLVRLGRHMEATYPDLYQIYRQPEFEWNKILQRNRNPLLRMDIGATGLTTGYTKESGYALLGATERDGRKTFLALSGLKSDADRSKEAKALLDWANQAFSRAVLFQPDEIVGQAAVYGGVAGSVGLVARAPVVAFVPTDEADRVSASIRYDGPVLAPVAAGDRVGQMVVMIDDKPSLSVDLYAASSVDQGSFTERATDALAELAFGWVRAL
ncbi:D-alanyl-D-alanine carboxypeptidase family protein [Antarcticirhabdus aurantiaca]|uniref:D-alanyl-D-alanine carboxypeptidase n=1 Tax=Antarcticirhabdus aurantiaca TaxID=2606717 RepID=A0ACD4NVS7_9HYPH|nr:D-alanyl-D-alanine carboxypeptidase family protein [Antarcticirhabdus aurantiaca]WAJ30922.1 D-alanyl-D-alanine carboxypeptidase [Jeongeuplla avenae]